MSFNINHNKMLGIIELIFAGSASGRDLQEASSRCISLGKEIIVKNFFIDASEIELTASVADLYNLPSRQYIEEAADIDNRVAIFLPSPHKAHDKAQLYERACKIYGRQTQVFSERQEAIDWLLQNTPDQ